MAEQTVSLIVRRTIRAPPARLFEAWTTPEHLERWWGPKNVRCSHAEVDLRVGGRYRIANELPDGNTLWIAGQFESITPPHELVYTWSIDDAPVAERVTVRFVARGGATDVIVVHERIADAASRDEHERGWIDCLAGLGELVQMEAPGAR